MSVPQMTAGDFVDPPDASSFPAPTFTPEPSCTRDIHYVVYPDLDCRAGTEPVACRYFHLGPTTSASECMPTDWKPSRGLWQSPGVCPEGYGMACASTIDDGKETTATCCPSGFSCMTTSGWPWYSTAPCYRDLDATIPFVYTTDMPGQDQQVFTTEGTDHTLHAYGLEIRFQSSDLGKSRTTETTSEAPTSETKTADRSSTGSTQAAPLSDNTLPTSTGLFPQSPSGESKSDGGLSTGATAGIGAGVGVVALALIGVLAWWFWRRRKGPEVEHLSQPFVAKTPWSQPELAGAQGATPAPWADGAQRQEMYAAHPPAELGTYR